MSSTLDGASELQHHDSPSASAAADAADPATTALRELTDEEVAERHRAWMVEHGRVYRDEAERERKLAAFRDNLRYVEAHNRGGHPYRLGLNKFADLTNEEFRATYCGGLCVATKEELSAEQERRRKGGPVLGSPPREARTG